MKNNFTMLCRLLFLLGFWLTASSLAVTTCLAEEKDPYDPFDIEPQQEESLSDQEKTPQQLIAEANLLLQEDRPLDARTRLLLALKKDPKEYHAHMLLAAYYMVHVGHFRLALKYVKQAQELFEEKNGKPPYTDNLKKQEHAHLLYLLSQARLDLDNYQGALDTLDEYASYGYYDDWYPGSRAWILMKLGRVDDAIKIARLGIFSGAEPGRTMNILGILLSMTGERQASIEVFKQAISYEYSLGDIGQPATPLNNVGEVYKEIFTEPKAESSWLKATSLPDGCEHVLPALNLALLHVDDLNLQLAKRAMDNFDSCVAQFPLRNGEEHRALVDMMRGRLALYSGDTDKAVSFLMSALEHRQWFGKIGTSQEDLQAALYVSLAQALSQHERRLKFRLPLSVKERLEIVKTRITDSIMSWWYMRRARQIMIEDLSSLEDIYIRNTDSMIEYPTFGDMLQYIPTHLLEERIKLEAEKDNRKEAQNYYKLYLAQNLLYHGDDSKALTIINELLPQLRPQFDSALRLKALLLKLSLIDPKAEAYPSVAQQVFAISRAALANNGFRLPVIAKVAPEILEDLSLSAFSPMTSEGLENSIKSGYKGEEYTLEFLGRDGQTIQVTDKDLKQAINKLTEKVFSQELK